MNQSELKNPKAIYRPGPFWSWNDQLCARELERQIDEMSQKGWGSYFMHSRVGLVTGYLSDEWMDLIKACAKKAEETGTYAWLYDEDKWPSGFAGGEISKIPEYRHKALRLLTDKEQITENDQILCEYDGYFISFYTFPFGNPWFNGYCYTDLMNPKAVQAFLTSTHEKYKAACGEHFGKSIPGVFTDEPCYLMQGHLDEPCLPWSDYLPEFFFELKGYRIEEHLPGLFFKTGDYHKIRYDFFDAATRLFIQSFSKPYYEWCEKNNLKLTGHFMAEDNLPYQISWIGAAMPHYEFMHWPGIDKLGRTVDTQTVTVKQLTSVTEQLGKERAFSEVFGCIGQQSSFWERKWIAQWQGLLGVSFINHHLSLYSMRGERKRDYPANLFYQQPWWEEERPFADYFARLSCYTATTARDVELLVLHPVTSGWCCYDPITYRYGLPDEIAQYDQAFADLSNALMDAQLDYHYGDEMLMEKYAKAENGRLIVGNCSYSTVIIPPALNLTKSTCNLLKAFIEQGGKVISIFPHPTLIQGEQGDLSLLERAQKALSVPACVKHLSEAAPDRVTIKDRISGKDAVGVWHECRRDQDAGYINIINKSEHKTQILNISFKADTAPLLVDLMSGEEYLLPVTQKDGRATLEATLMRGGSLLIKLPHKSTAAPMCPPFISTGAQLDGFTPVGNGSFNAAKILEHNALPLNDVTLYLDGKKAMDNAPVNTAWHEHFYPAKNGTPFRAEYSFTVKSLPNGKLYAAVEMASNLTSITFNGRKVTPPDYSGTLDENCWKDVNFSKVELGEAVTGENLLVLEGVKVNNITGPGCHVAVPDFKNHKPTEVESVYIIGDFCVETANKTAFWITSPKPADPKDITASGYPFYAGQAKLTAEFDADGELPSYLRLDLADAACARVFVNGKDCSVGYWTPFAYDISKAVQKGKNTVEIMISTTLFNLMGPDRVANVEQHTYISPQTFVNFAEGYTPEYTLMPFGVGGFTLIK